MKKPALVKEYADSSAHGFVREPVLVFSRNVGSDLEDDDAPRPPISTDPKSIFNRLPVSREPSARPRYRNFSHISEFSSGLDMPNKSHKKKDKVGEFLEKKRETKHDQALVRSKEDLIPKEQCFGFLLREINEKKKETNRSCSPQTRSRRLPPRISLRKKYFVAPTRLTYAMIFNRVMQHYQ